MRSWCEPFVTARVKSDGTLYVGKQTQEMGFCWGGQADPTTSTARRVQAGAREGAERRGWRGRGIHLPVASRSPRKNEAPLFYRRLA